MGLDQYLEARKYVSNWTFSKQEDKQAFHSIAEALGLTDDDLDQDSPSISVEVPVGYWRKAHQIHDWFVQNLQEGVDDCKAYYVGRVELEALHLICGQIMDTPRLAKELLPITDDHYAVSEYNEWYFEQIAYTRKMLRKILDNDKLSCYDFYYRSSW